jgi:4-amino-4-deoxy-L-arabinose transferase-like glycosyltransferase
VKRLSLRLWLLIAAAFHVTVTLFVYLIGHFHLLPNTFDENGIGLTFAADGLLYQRITSALANALRRGDFRTWLEIQAPFHCRLYSFAFVFPGSIVGYNILAAEPLSLIYFLAVLTLVYLLGREIFDSTTGFRAAVVIAVWPSFLLHSTQLTRDSLAIVAMLSLLLILVRLVGGPIKWRSALLMAITGGSSATLFWVTRGNMWTLVFFELAFTTLLLAILIIRERKVPLTNLGVLALIIAAVLFVPPHLESSTVFGSLPPTPLIDVTSSTVHTHSLWERLLRQINGRRQGFNRYLGNSSNIDSDASFETAGDVVRYLPRAAEIGLFAPFPRMWFEVGTVGRMARVVAGIETLIMYLFYIPAAVCVWKQRRNLKLWLVFLFALTGLIGLGFVVANVGALFRLRYVFWIMMILLAVKGTLELRRDFKRSPE